MKFNLFLIFLCLSINIHSKANPLITAIKKSDLSTVKKLVQEGANVNLPDENGATPLMWAAYKSNLEMVRYLIENGADANTKGVIWFKEPDASFGNLLGIAAFKGDLLLIAYLIEEIGISPFDRGYHPISKKEDGWTAYEYAALMRKKKVLEYLSQFESPLIVITRNHAAATEENGQIPPLLSCLEIYPNSITTTDEYGRTSLHIASNTGNIPIMEILVRAGATINSIDNNGKTSLHFACQNGQYQAAKWLIEKGANLDFKDHKENTPLMLAARADHVAIVKMTYYLTKDKPLDNVKRVALGQSKKFLENPTPDYFLLLDLGLDKQVLQDLEKGLFQADIKDALGNTLLHKAAEYGYEMLAVKLLEKGLDVNQKRQNGSTPLMVAAFKNQGGIAKILVQNKVEVNLKSPKGFTALHLACQWSDLEILQLLIDSGANVEDKLEGFITSPLMIAAYFNRPDIVEYLLNHKADIQELNHEQANALHISITGYQNLVNLLFKESILPVEQLKQIQKIEKQHLETVKVLLAKGIDVKQKNKQNETAFEVAQHQSTEEVIEWLNSYQKEINSSLLNTHTNLLDNTRITLPIGHNAEIADVDVSPNGRYIISGSADKYVIIWDLQTGMELFRKAFEETISAVAFSPDGKNFVVVTNTVKYNIQLWHFGDKNIQHLKSFKGQQGAPIPFVYFTPDGSKIITIARDGTFRVIDIINKEVVQEVKAHVSTKNVAPIIGAALSPNGRWLATGSEDSKVKIWNVASGQLQQTLEGHATSITALSFSPDGQFLASADFSGQLITWDWQKGEQNFTYKKDRHINTITYSNDGKILVLDDLILERATHKEISINQGHLLNVNAVCFAPDDKFLVTAGSFADASVKVWDAHTGHLIRDLRGHTEGSFALPLKDSEILTVSKFARYPQAKGLRRWNIAEGTMNLVYEANFDVSFTAVALSKDKKFVALGMSSEKMGEDGILQSKYFIEVKSLNNLNATVARFEGCKGIITSLAFSPDGHYLVSGGGEIPWLPDIIDFNYDPLANLQFDSIIRVWEISSGAKIDSLEGHTSSVTHLCFSPDGKKLLSSGMDRSTKIWTFPRSIVLKSIPSGSPAIFVQNGRQVVIRDMFHPLIIWDIETNTTTPIPLQSSSFPVSLGWSEEKQQLLVGMMSGELYLWDLPTNQLLQQFKGHTFPIISIQYLEENDEWLTTAQDGTMKTWQRENDIPIATYVTIDRNDFITFLPNLYYRGTKNAIRKVGFAKNKKTYFFEQFDRKFNRPDILLENIGLASPDLIKLYQEVYKKRLSLEGLTLNNDNPLIVPSFEVTNNQSIPITNANREFTFSVKADGKGILLKKVIATINNYPAKVVDLESKSSTRFEGALTLKLSTGSNKINIYVINNQGIESYKRSFDIYYKGSNQKPDLHLITIGVSEHQNSKQNLNYPAKDAEDLTALFKEKTNDYHKIHTHLLTNEAVTLSNFEQLKTKLKDVKIDDRVIIFYAGHGVLDKSLNLFLSTYETKLDEIEKGSISYTYLHQLINNIPSRNKLLLLDACHTGEIDDSAPSVRLSPPPEVEGDLKTRDASRRFPKQLDKDFFHLMKELFIDFRNRTGTIVIAATTGTQVALEGNQWNNGAFTYCLIEGLQKGYADLNKDGKITVSELETYLLKRVPEATGGRQQPIMRQELILGDWEVW